MVRAAVKHSARLVVLLAGLAWVASACSSHAMCVDGLKHAPSGDSLCVGKAECSTTSGQPDHQGCPNTCSCVCSDGQCFERDCTAIFCSGEPSVYR